MRSLVDKDEMEDVVGGEENVEDEEDVPWCVKRTKPPSVYKEEPHIPYLFTVRVLQLN